MNQGSLFQTFSLAIHWEAFDSWLKEMQRTGRIKRGATAEVYRDMWGSFAAWCAAQNPGIALDALTPEDLTVFQQSRSGTRDDLSVTPRHARRLLGLIDRVLRHHSSGTEAPNLAAEEAINAQLDVRHANATKRDVLPSALDGGAARELVTFLSRARPRAGATAEALSWQLLRNRVSVALQLGAGLTPGDIRALTLSSPVLTGGRVKGRPWKIHVPGNGTLPPREAPIASWAGELLQHWLHIRNEQEIPGPWLFPSTRTGKPWGKVAQYTAASDVMKEAGLVDHQGGSFQLRHTFALRQLRRGTEPAIVAGWLGLDEAKMLAKYKGILYSPVDVV